MPIRKPRRETPERDLVAGAGPGSRLSLPGGVDAPGGAGAAEMTRVYSLGPTGPGGGVAGLGVLVSGPAPASVA
jgi:hypothetical protein